MRLPHFIEKGDKELLIICRQGIVDVSSEWKQSLEGVFVDLGRGFQNQTGKINFLCHGQFIPTQHLRKVVDLVSVKEELGLESAVVQIRHFLGDFRDHFEALLESLSDIGLSFGFVLYNLHPAFSSILQEPALASDCFLYYVQSVCVFDVLSLFNFVNQIGLEIFREVVKKLTSKFQGRFVPLKKRA